MEVLRGCGAIGYPQVIATRKLQETFEPRARMFRPLALVPVRQEQHEPRSLPPLGPRRRDELIDDHLCRIGEVAVLRLPEDQHLTGQAAVAILEAEGRTLRERTIVDG